MRRCIQWIVVSAFLAGALLVSSDRATNAAPPPPKSTTKKPTKPQVKPHPTSKKTFKVQARAPLWRGVAVVSSSNAAHAVKQRLNRQGWQAKVHHNKRTSVYAVSARMVHWHTRAVTHNPAAAQRAALILMAQGFQARII